jgi:transketolase
MIKENAKLNSKIFDTDVEQKPIRSGFGEGLLIAGETDINVVGLCADLTESTKMDAFAKKYPERFIEVGVAEQNLATVASGMAAMGKIPFITSYAMFSPGRNWEQIRTTICYNNVPVKIAGSHAGISVGPDGGTHQAIEDIALMRVIPRMVVISPCDAVEARKATIAAAKTKDPTYIRLARNGTPVITTDETPFEIGKAEVFFDTPEPVVAIVVSGSLVHNTLLAAQELLEAGVQTTVINLHTIKPLDKDLILATAKRVKGFVTVEEHQSAGGMGSAVAELLLTINHPLPMSFVAIQDEFGQSGTPSELLTHYGLDKNAIIKAVKKLL